MNFSTFSLLAFLVFYLFLVGSPIAISARISALIPAPEIRWCMAAIGGFVIMIAVATILTTIGFPSRPYFVAAPAISVGLSMMLWYRQNMPSLVPASQQSSPACLILLLMMVIIIVSFDIDRLGLENYIPLTNDDTFSYFGHIDQIRDAHKQLPSIVYPAGYSPFYQAGITLRVAVSSFCAALADLTQTQTHAAFFLTLRLCYVMATLGVVAVIGLLGKMPLTAIAWAAIFAASNLMTHQIYQQFLSSAVGVVCELGILIAALLTIRSGFDKVFVFGLGVVSGIMAMSSPEAFPFLVIALTLFVMIETLVTRDRLGFFFCLPVFVAGFAVGCAPVLGTLFSAVYGQGAGALGGHPGDWFACPISVFQAAGLFFISLNRLTNHTTVYEDASLVLVLGLGATGVITLLARAAKGALGENKNSVAAAGLRWVAALAVVYLGSALTLYAIGRGYGYLKVLDYFCFMPLLLAHYGSSAIAAYFRSRQPPKYRGPVSVSHGVAALYLSIFIYACVTAKVAEAMRYQSNIVATKSFDIYRVSKWSLGVNGNSDPRRILLDVAEPKLNLVLYLNRYDRDRLIFSQNETYRYIPVPDTGVFDSVFRLGYMDDGDIDAIQQGYTMGRDITRPHESFVSALSEVVPADGYIKLVNGVGSHWLPPAGEIPENSPLRWLSTIGDFTVYQSADPTKYYKLHVELSPGPDIDPLQHIVIVLAGTPIATLAPAELPVTLDLPLDRRVSGAMTSGEIRVEGPHHGIREVNVGGLYLSRQ